MTPRKELVRRLRARYEEQCGRFPTTRDDIPWGMYKRRAMRYMHKLDAEMIARGRDGALSDYAKGSET